MKIKMTLNTVNRALPRALPIVVALAYLTSPGWAASLLGSELASFAILGGATVTNTGATTLNGNLGVDPGTAITGKATIVVNGTSAATIGNPSVHEADAFATQAQVQLASAMTSLGLLGPGTLLGANLAGLTLTPGIYTVPAGVSNLTGTLTLDGLGNANAAWVFQMPSTLITSSDSNVNMINAGAGAGLFWMVGSSATLGTTTSFAGNILAQTSISLNTGASLCGSALAHTGAVTMDSNTIGCGDSHFAGGLSVPEGGGMPVFLATAPIPEPETYALLALGLGLLGWVARRRTHQTA